MTDSTHQSVRTDAPRAIIHKKILDAAEASPEESYEALANRVSGASVGLVEQVLEDYGDPAGDGSVANEGETPSPDIGLDGVTTGAAGGNEDSETETRGATRSLSDKQLETFRAIAANPEATQAEIAEALGVSPATVCTRVNDVDDFEWSNRVEYVEDVIVNGDPALESEKQSAEPAEPLGDNTSGLAQQVARHSDQLDRLEQRFNELTSPALNIFEDSELVLKVIHACVLHDQITEEEELRILKTIVRDGE